MAGGKIKSTKRDVFRYSKRRVFVNGINALAKQVASLIGGVEIASSNNVANLVSRAYVSTRRSAANLLFLFLDFERFLKFIIIIVSHIATVFLYFAPNVTTVLQFFVCVVTTGDIDGFENYTAVTHFKESISIKAVFSVHSFSPFIS